MIFTYMGRYGDSIRSRDFGTIERFIEPCILLLLSREPTHGYGLMEGLAKHCGKRVYTITETGRAFLKNAVTSLQQTDELIHHLFSGYQKIYLNKKTL